ncbi:MAG: hypothetical protein RLZZ387_4077 [Chloroflexota bacterium]
MRSRVTCEYNQPHCIATAQTVPFSNYPLRADYSKSAATCNPSRGSSGMS